MATFVMSDRLLESLAQALGLDVKRVSRVVIDLQACEVAKVYVEQYGTTDLLDVLTPMVDTAVVVNINEKQPPPGMEGWQEVTTLDEVNNGRRTFVKGGNNDG